MTVQYTGESKVIRRLCEAVSALPGVPDIQAGAGIEITQSGNTVTVSAKRPFLFVDSGGYICADYGGD